MISEAEYNNVLESAKNDTWHFTQDANGFFWMRTASNGEIVGTSHRAFALQEECYQNARLVGYQGMFLLPKSVQWQLYKDTKGMYRWRVLTNKGVVLNRSHEGYTSKLARDKNAARHGCSEVLQSTNTQSCDCIFACSHSSPILAPWLAWLILALFIGLAAVVLLPATPASVPIVVPDSEYTPMPLAECMQSLQEDGVVQGFKTEAGDRNDELNLEAFISKQELAKMLMVATDNGVFACAPTTSEPAGENWAWPYINCANAKDWRLYNNLQADYTQRASKSDLVVTLLDAYNLTPEQADSSRIYQAVGEFTPDELVTREQVALAICNTRQLLP